MFNSRGFKDAAAKKGAELEAALLKASENGAQQPVVGTAGPVPTDCPCSTRLCIAHLSVAALQRCLQSIPCPAVAMLTSLLLPPAPSCPCRQVAHCVRHLPLPGPDQVQPVRPRAAVGFGKGFCRQSSSSSACS